MWRVSPAFLAASEAGYWSDAESEEKTNTSTSGGLHYDLSTFFAYPVTLLQSHEKTIPRAKIFECHKYHSLRRMFLRGEATKDRFPFVALGRLQPKDAPRSKQVIRRSLRISSSSYDIFDFCQVGIALTMSGLAMIWAKWGKKC